MNLIARTSNIVLSGALDERRGAEERPGLARASAIQSI